MYRCPNDGYVGKNTRELERKNQLGRKFSDIFNMLLDPSYYEGTTHGRYFNTVNPDGTSRIYVRDPLEDELQEFCNSRGNGIRYLVGFTGMGKTTLLRNFYKIQDRDVHLYEGRLVVYISFYYANLTADAPQRSVEDEVVRYLSRAISIILQSNEQLLWDEDQFWNGLYDYIEHNKPVSLQSQELIPGISLNTIISSSNKKTLAEKKTHLEKTCQKNRIEYYSSLLKYVISITEKIHDVHFIFDDIESKEAIFHRPVVEVARHLQSCFSCIDGKQIWAKTIVSLRAYTFRSNVDRQLEARREQIEKNTIFKRETVSLSEIFKKRFQAISEIQKVDDRVKNIASYQEAVNQLDILSRQIDISFSKIIYYLANCNLFHAMAMYNSVLLNVEWIAKFEVEKAGGFQISADSYKLTAKTVFRALACGNEITYFDKRNTFFPNILHNGREEGAELFNLLIIRYLMKKGASDLYGETYVQLDQIVQDVTDVFLKNSDSNLKVERWQERIANCLDYLYDSGVLLRSIYDIETINPDQIERTVDKAVKVYLSPRGQYLYSLFSENALLLELYRDMIFIDLENNDRLTAEMKTYDVMDYLIAYVSKLFEYEKRYIGDAILNLRQYQAFFGEELLVSPLLEGIVRNLKSYYSENGNEYNTLMEKVQKLIRAMKHYIGKVKEDNGVLFSVSRFLTTNL